MPRPLEDQVRDLMDAIDRKWGQETPRKRANAISPRMMSLIAELRQTLGMAKWDVYEGD